MRAMDRPEWFRETAAEVVRLGGTETGMMEQVKAYRSGSGGRGGVFAGAWADAPPHVAAQLLVWGEGREMLARGKALGERGWRLMQASQLQHVDDAGTLRPGFRAALWAGAAVVAVGALVTGAMLWL